MKKLLSIMFTVAGAVTVFSACTWGWADAGCTSSGCTSGGCSTGSYIFTKWYCRQMGNYCCECQEDVYNCNGSGCDTFRYARFQWPSTGTECTPTTGTNKECL